MTRLTCFVLLFSLALGGCAHRIAIEKKENPHEGHFWHASRQPIVAEDIAAGESPFPKR